MAQAPKQMDHPPPYWSHGPQPPMHHGHGPTSHYPPYTPGNPPSTSTDGPEPGAYHHEPPHPQSQPYMMYYHQPPHGNMHPPSQYHPPPDDGNGGGHGTSSHSNSGMRGRGDEYGAHSNDHSEVNGERYERGGEPSPGNHSGNHLPPEAEASNDPRNDAPPNPHRSMPDHSQGHASQGHPSQGHPGYPTPSPYYPPHPSYGHPTHPPPGSCPPPPEAWNAPPPAAYYPHYDANGGYHYPPQYPYAAPYPQHPQSSSARPEMPPGGGIGPPKAKKARLSSTLHEWSGGGHGHDGPPKEAANPHAPDRTKPPSVPRPKTTARRKKKMYSDFVGVTYNKTHAKYQACITHYRKQHYLGRYRLAVDAALAYDESARLLKGSSWKVNFPTRKEYEEAKARELEGLGKAGGASAVASVDVAGSLAAVAMKVEEIANGVGGGAARGHGGAPGPTLMMHGMAPHSGPHNPGARPGHEEYDGAVAGRGERRTTPGPFPPPHPPRPTARHPTPGSMSKVTPSPTFQFVPQGRDAPPSDGAGSFETPVAASPNPSRHIMGMEKNTPDSVIRPTVLSYRGGEGGPRPAVAGAARSPPPPKRSPSADAENAGRVAHEPRRTPARPADAGAPASAPKAEAAPPAAETGAEAPAATPKAKAAPSAAPPVIQNGTLAAASALMTLFEVERSPKA